MDCVLFKTRSWKLCSNSGGWGIAFFSLFPQVPGRRVRNPDLCTVCFIFLTSTGEIIKIITEEYVQHLSGYLFKFKFDPSLLFGQRFQYSNRIALEFCHLYHWHPLMPDSFHVDGDDIPHSRFSFNTSLLLHYGVEKLVDAFSRQPAGQVEEERNA